MGDDLPIKGPPSFARRFLASGDLFSLNQALAEQEKPPNNCRRQLQGCMLQRHFTLAICQHLQGLSWSFDGVAQLPGVRE